MTKAFFETLKKCSLSKVDWGIIAMLAIAGVLVLTLCARVIAPHDSAVLMSVLIVMLTAFAIVVVCKVLRIKSVRVPIELYVCSAVVLLGLIFSAFFPPFLITDEVAHYRAAYSMANVLLFRGDEPVMRADDLAFLNETGSRFITSGYYATVANDFALFAKDSSLVSTDLMGTYSIFGAWPPQVTFAPAFGIAMAQLIGLGTIPAIYLGRLCNLIFFVALLFFAIRITPEGKKILAVIALFPMTLHLVSSLSYDAGLLGMAFLLFALMMQGVMGKGRMQTKDMAGILILSALLAPCKVIYSLMLFLVLFIKQERFESRWQGVLFKVAVFALPAILVAITSLSRMVDLSSVQVSGEESERYSLFSIVSHPVWFVDLVVNTLYQKADFYLFSMLGYSLGYFQPEVTLPQACLIPFLVFALFAVIRREDEPPLTVLLRFTMIVIFMSVLFLAMVSMLLANTEVGSSVIEGVQGRYLLPVLPLLLLGLRGKSIVAKTDCTFALVSCEIIASAYIASINVSLILAM